MLCWWNNNHFVAMLARTSDHLRLFIRSSRLVVFEHPRKTQKVNKEQFKFYHEMIKNNS